MEDAGQAQGSDREKLISDLKLVIKDAEELLRNTGQQMDSSYRAARARFDSTLQNARTGLGSAQGKAVESSKDAMEATERYVRENPWPAMGIGAVAGLVIGLLLNRK